MVVSERESLRNSILARVGMSHGMACFADDEIFEDSPSHQARCEADSSRQRVPLEDPVPVAPGTSEHTPPPTRASPKSGGNDSQVFQESDAEERLPQPLSEPAVPKRPSALKKQNPKPQKRPAAAGPPEVEPETAEPAPKQKVLKRPAANAAPVVESRADESGQQLCPAAAYSYKDESGNWEVGDWGKKRSL